MTDDVVVRLGPKRRVSVKVYMGNVLVDVRETFEKDGQELPSKKGISLTVDQWKTLVEERDAINAAIEALQADKGKGNSNARKKARSEAEGETPAKKAKSSETVASDDLAKDVGFGSQVKSESNDD